MGTYYATFSLRAVGVFYIGYVPNHNHFTSKVEGFTFRVLGFGIWVHGFRLRVVTLGL